MMYLICDTIKGDFRRSEASSYLRESFPVGSLVPFFVMVFLAKGFVAATPLIVRGISGNLMVAAAPAGASGRANRSDNGERAGREDGREGEAFGAVNKMRLQRRSYRPPRDVLTRCYRPEDESYSSDPIGGKLV